MERCSSSRVSVCMQEEITLDYDPDSLSVQLYTVGVGLGDPIAYYRGKRKRSRTKMRRKQSGGGGRELEVAVGKCERVGTRETPTCQLRPILFREIQLPRRVCPFSTHRTENAMTTLENLFPHVHVDPDPRQPRLTISCPSSC